MGGRDIRSEHEEADRVRAGGRGFTTIAGDKADRYVGAVIAHRRAGCGVSRRAGKGVRGGYSAEVKGSSNYTYRRGEEFVIYITGVGVERGGNGSRSPVNGVTGGHNREVRTGRDRVPRVGRAAAGVRRLDRISYPRVGRRISV